MATSNNTQITNREYISEVSSFLRELESKADNNKSEARQAEENKYARINKLRDEVQANNNGAKLWQGF